MGCRCQVAKTEAVVAGHAQMARLFRLIQTLISESLTDPVNKGLIGDAFSATVNKDFQFTFASDESR